MRTQRLIAYAFAACLASLLAGTAMAADGSGNFNAFLKGTYRLSNSLSCATSINAGFNPETLESLGPGGTDHIYLTDVITYDGHATMTDHGIFLSGAPHDSSTRPVGTFEENCNFTYAVNRDGSFSQEGNCKATDESYTLTGSKNVGQIAVEGSVLILNLAEPVEQTLILRDGTTIFRICGYEGAAVRLHPK